MRRLACLALLAAVACSPGAGSGAVGAPAVAPAVTALFAQLSARIRLVDDLGQPVANAQVSLVEVTDADPSTQVPETLWCALTHADGIARGDCRVPTRTDLVDVLVHAPGHRGAYSDASLRAALGPTATSARLRLPVAAIVDLTLTLERLP